MVAGPPLGGDPSWTHAECFLPDSASLPPQQPEEVVALLEDSPGHHGSKRSTSPTSLGNRFQRAQATACLRDAFPDDHRFPHHTEKGSEVTKCPHLHQTILTGQHLAVGLLGAFNMLVDAVSLQQELEYTAFPKPTTPELFVTGPCGSMGHSLGKGACRRREVVVAGSGLGSNISCK